MPKEVSIGEEIICIDNSPERLIRTSIYRGAKRTMIFEGGIGKFQDLLFKDQVLIARTDEGWYYSKDIGITWINADNWRIENPDFFEETDEEYLFMKRVLQEYVNLKPALIDHNDPLLADWLQEEVLGRVEIIEVNDYHEDNLLRSALLQSLSEHKFNRFLYILGDETKENLSESIYKIHAENKLLRKDRLLDKVINESIFIENFDLCNLYNFEQMIRGCIMRFDSKTVLISDLYKFFEKDKSPDFIESTFNLLCEICDRLNIRIIAVINLERSGEMERSILPKTFRNRFLERFQVVIQDQNSPVKIKSKDGY